MAEHLSQAEREQLQDLSALELAIMADDHYRWARLKEAEPLYREAMRRGDLSEALRFSCWNMAIYCLAGRGEARDSITETLQITEALLEAGLTDARSNCRPLETLAFVYSIQDPRDNRRRVDELYESIAAQLDSNTDPYCELNLWASRLWRAIERKEPQTARECLRGYETVRRRIDMVEDISQQEWCRYQTARILEFEGDHQAAAELLLEVTRRVRDDRPNEQTCYAERALAKISREFGDPGEAVAHAGVARDEGIALGNGLEQARCLLGLGRARRKIGDDGQAHDDWQDALTITRRLGLRGLLRDLQAELDGRPQRDDFSDR